MNLIQKVRDVNGVAAEVTGDSGADYDNGGAIGGIHEMNMREENKRV